MVSRRLEGIGSASLPCGKEHESTPGFGKGVENTCLSDVFRFRDPQKSVFRLHRWMKLKVAHELKGQWEQSRQWQLEKLGAHESLSCSSTWILCKCCWFYWGWVSGPGNQLSLQRAKTERVLLKSSILGVKHWIFGYIRRNSLLDGRSGNRRDRWRLRDGDEERWVHILLEIRRTSSFPSERKSYLWGERPRCSPLFSQQFWGLEGYKVIYYSS